MERGKRPLAVSITGPTATGKTDAAVALCQALHGEVISMDSMQIYRDFTLGTAKPTVAEMGGVAHHMLSFLPPDARYTVAEYQRDATATMHEVLGRGHLPVFVGGTGLYLQAVSHPLTFAEAKGAGEIRQRLQAEAEAPEGPANLHAQLMAVDPASAARLHPNNTRRVIRALEVYLETGEPMSAQAHEWEAEPSEHWCIFALTWPREVLYARINMRVDRMIAHGLVDEVSMLLEKGVSRHAQAMQAIGYKEIVEMLDGKCSREDAIEAVKRNTRRYAKRQLTWLRRDSRVEWIDCAAYADGTAMHQDLIDRTKRFQEDNDAGN